ncbi:hypothetical protein DOY81_012578 [Sarcophaga bullata]|nr:hypothetical protein DOY81_012578 [Sarcophaga bullata]
MVHGPLKTSTFMYSVKLKGAPSLTFGFLWPTTSLEHSTSIPR